MCFKPQKTTKKNKQKKIIKSKIHAFKLPIKYSIYWCLPFTPTELQVATWLIGLYFSGTSLLLLRVPKATPSGPSTTRVLLKKQKQTTVHFTPDSPVQHFCCIMFHFLVSYGWKLSRLSHQNLLPNMKLEDYNVQLKSHLIIHQFNRSPPPWTRSMSRKESRGGCGLRTASGCYITSLPSGYS